MLKGISPILSPDLLKTLHEMGHGDEILLADAHFPGHSCGQRVLRADGLSIPQLLNALMPLFELDGPNSSLVMMLNDSGSPLDPSVEADFLSAIRRHGPAAPSVVRLGREDFYDRSKKCYAIVMTGEFRPYGNLLLRKGVTPLK